MALKLLLQLAQEHVFQQLKWIIKEAQIKKFTLYPLYDDIQMQLPTFSQMSLFHIYGDMNNVANDLSKVGLDFDNVPRSLPSYRMVTLYILHMHHGYKEISSIYMTED